MSGNSGTRKPRTPVKKNVMITGATGTIGRQLTEKLLYDPKVGQVLAVSSDPLPYYFEDYSPKQFAYQQVNILKGRELTNLFLSEAFRNTRVNTVVHLASQHSPAVDMQYRHTLNVIGTKNLIEKCLESRQITKFIYRSSANVYKIRPHNSVFLSEDAELNMDADAHPTIKDEVDADLLCRAHMDNGYMKIIVLRPTGVIGRNVQSFFAAMYASRWVAKPIGFNPMINLIHSNDVIRAIQLSIHRDVQGVFNISGKETAPLSEFCRLSGRNPHPLLTPLIPRFYKAQRMLGTSKFYPEVNLDRLHYSCLLDTRKAREVLGFEPTYHVKFQDEQ